MRQAFLKKEQERKEAELLAEKQEALRKRKEEKRIAKEVGITYSLKTKGIFLKQKSKVNLYFQHLDYVSKRRQTNI